MFVIKDELLMLGWLMKEVLKGYLFSFDSCRLSRVSVGRYVLVLMGLFIFFILTELGVL